MQAASPGSDKSDLGDHRRWDDTGATTLVRTCITGAQLPIIIAVPHGGGSSLGEQRKFLKLRRGTWQAEPGASTLGLALCASLLAESERRPCAVIARFHRSFVDVALPESAGTTAAEPYAPGCDEGSPADFSASSLYARYHCSLAAAVDRACVIGGELGVTPVLLDVHSDSALCATVSIVVDPLVRTTSVQAGAFWAPGSALSELVSVAASDSVRCGDLVRQLHRKRVTVVEVRVGSYLLRDDKSRRELARKLALAMAHDGLLRSSSSNHRRRIAGLGDSASSQGAEGGGADAVGAGAGAGAGARASVCTAEGSDTGGGDGEASDARSVVAHVLGSEVVRCGYWTDNGAHTLVRVLASCVMPVIITAPHGGSASHAHQSHYLEERPKGPGVAKLADGGTAELAMAIVGELGRLSGGRHPAAVIARFHRRYVDANRSLAPKQAAVAGPNGRACYDRYHAAVAEAVRSIVDRFGGKHKEFRPLLLDIHGQADKRFTDVILRGTACGRTANIHAMYRPDGFLAQLGEELRPHPKLDGNRKWPLGKEYAGYSGGFTVQQYRSKRLDCVQLEFGSQLRAAREVKRVAARVAQAVMTAGYAARQPCPCL